MSDRENSGLRGPVKTCTEERVSKLASDTNEIRFTTTTEYSATGRVLKRLSTSSNGSEFAVTYSYAPDGKLLKTISENKGGPSYVSVYEYDESGRLLDIRPTDKSARFGGARVSYDADGRKSMTQTFDSTPLPPNTAYATHWEGTDLGFAPYPGGTLTTAYNEQGVATGAQLRDSQGRLVAHIARTFDVSGRISAEEQIVDAPELMIPEELHSELNPGQAKALGTWMAGGLLNRGISYSYDAQGRMTERRKSGGAFGEQQITIAYNDHGDKASEFTTTVMDPDVGREYSLTEAGTMIPIGPAQPVRPPTFYETHYTYQYDSYGNWVEQAVTSRANPDQPFSPSEVYHRILTYY